MTDYNSVALWLEKYHRITNYLSASMLYLNENFLLENELAPEHIKPRILGHWGSVPGVNVAYGALNYLVKEHNQESMLILGTGHAAPGIISGLWLEGTLQEYYPKATLDKDGMGYIIKNFSWPGGFPSHTYPGLPGSIHEGGELGYSLGTAYGAAFDNPNLMVAVIIGDGEAETGPLAASWQCNKFINPKRDGMVLPILHLNGYRISGPTFFGTMTDEEIRDYFYGLSYFPVFINARDSKNPYLEIIQGFEDAYQKMQHVKDYWDPGEKTFWPVIVLKSKKGWTCPKEVDGIKIEDHNNSHGIPLQNPVNNPDEFSALKDWLESYEVKDLLDKNLAPKSDLMQFIPKENMRLGKSKHTNAGNIKKDLILPTLADHEIRVEKKGERMESRMVNLGQYLRDIFSLNDVNSNFKLFSPDESESNLLTATYQETDRRYMWPVRERDEFYSYEGNIIEMLSEHVLQELISGYILTGRHGVYASYEAFFGLISNQVCQYIKFLEQSKNISWRKPLSSLNLIATSTAWRQEHNGFSHQNPTLINTLLTKETQYVNIYFPADVNTLMVTMEHCLRSTNCVNLIIACKRPTPQWLTLEEAKPHVQKGLSVWHWVETTHQDDMPDVVLASAGDYQTVETIAAIQILNELIPEIKIRYVNVNELTSIGLGDKHRALDTDNEYERYFTTDRDVIFNFHGYSDAIKQLTWGHEISERMKILAYSEKGTTTTPFDMQVVNGTSRYHVAIEAIKAAGKWNRDVKEKELELISFFEQLLEKHKKYIVEFGDDIPEVKNFKFKF